MRRVKGSASFFGVCGEDRFAETFRNIAVLADQERGDPQHVVHTRFLNAFDMVGKIRKFFIGNSPVADGVVPGGDGLRRNPLHVVITPAVINNQGLEAQPDGFRRNAFHPVLIHHAVNGVPGAEHRIPRVVRESRCCDIQRLDPVRQCFRPKQIAAAVQGENVVAGVFLDRNRDGDVIRAFLLVHPGVDLHIIIQVAQSNGCPVFLFGIEERHIREIPLGGGFALNNPDDSAAGNPFFRNPEALKIQDGQ